MTEELNLVSDLAVILIAAGVFTIISKALRQPLILGYIIAGFVIGPHLGLFHITSQESVSQWSEIGIIFLLFALGLEFSFKKLLKVGSSAMLMAGIKCIGMFVVGIILGEAMKWSMMESIFLGGLLSMSSTTIIIKAFSDMGLKNKPYAPLIFGSLVVEDLIAVLLMVLLSTLAATGQFEGGKMAMALGKLVFFIVLWFLVGIYVIPTVLKKVKSLLNDETLLILSIGLCFLMVTVAGAVGFSSALGAFVMGSILAETLEGERIEHLLGNIKDLFGAIFFVSVGMMVDPAVIGSQWAPILLITVVAMAGILIFSSAGAIIAGTGLDTAVHAGFSLAQLGEFAFIIASLGVSLGVMREFIYPVIIAVSVITTFTTPYMIKAAAPVSEWLQKKLPRQFLDKINGETTDDFSYESQEEHNHWKVYLQHYFIRLGIYTVLLIAISIGSTALLGKFLSAMMPDWPLKVRNITAALLTVFAMSPFLYGLTLTDGKMRSARNLLQKERHSNLWKFFALDVVKLLISVSFILWAIIGHFHFSWEVLLTLIALTAVGYYFIRRLFKKNFRLEEQFFSNLDATERRERRRAPVTVNVRRNLEKYNVHIEMVCLSPDSEYVGKPLRALPFRKIAKVNIIKIQRGSRSMTIPSGDTVIYPYDRILAVGTEEQLAEFRSIMKEHEAQYVPPRSDVENDADFVVRPVELTRDSILVGHTLRQTRMRSWNCMLICYLRDGKIVSNPSPDEPFQEGDLVWLAGEGEKIYEFLNQQTSTVYENSIS